MRTQKIAVIPGDGIGQEVTREGLRLLETLKARHALPIEVLTFDLGADRFLRDGTTFPDDVARTIREDCSAVLLGALGDPRVPGLEYARDILFGFRFGLELYQTLAGAEDDEDGNLVISPYSIHTAMAMALIENIQREDLNPMEQATAMHRFVEEFELTHQQIAEAVGKARATVSNLLRLMALPREVKTLLEHGDLEMGHARALLALPEQQQTEAARLIVAKGFSVRQTESLVRSLLAAKENPSDTKRVDPNVADLQQSLIDKLGAAVQINYNKKGQGKLIISYNSFEELDGILAHIQ